MVKYKFCPIATKNLNRIWDKLWMQFVSRLNSLIDQSIRTLTCYSPNSGEAHSEGGNYENLQKSEIKKSTHLFVIHTDSLIICDQQGQMWIRAACAISTVCCLCHHWMYNVQCTLYMHIFMWKYSRWPAKVWKFCCFVTNLYINWYTFCANFYTFCKASGIWSVTIGHKKNPSGIQP